MVQLLPEYSQGWRAHRAMWIQGFPSPSPNLFPQSFSPGSECQTHTVPSPQRQRARPLKVSGFPCVGDTPQFPWLPPAPLTMVTRAAPSYWVPGTVQSLPHTQPPPTLPTILRRALSSPHLQRSKQAPGREETCLSHSVGTGGVTAAALNPMTDEKSHGPTWGPSH